MTKYVHIIIVNTEGRKSDVLSVHADKQKAVEVVKRLVKNRNYDEHPHSLYWENGMHSVYILSLLVQP